jgi:membrane-bound ClpP family serine protease
MTALGLLLLLLGATLVVVEAHVPSLGALAVPGVVALVVGSVLAVSGLGGGLALVTTAAAVLAFGSISGLAWIMRKGSAARRRRVRTGAESLIGRLGVVRSWGEPDGRVLLEGALWRAQRAWPGLGADAEVLREGDVVVVERLNGLTLSVRGADEWERHA